ncbi:MAG TPA: NUDIX domain-containing protein [Bacteroidia bacterium]|jgi:8-oxo-dGTP pyrophosphatase MutT (NUDIX family)|nr:NUDIX domain-containing protein [Bacteroidia bacterium]
MKYTVYIGETPVSFVDGEMDIPQGEGVMYTSMDDTKTLKGYVEMVEKNPQVRHLIIRTNDPEKALNVFSKLFQVIEAAGGMVFNSERKALFIFRNGKWDLPKGKVEKNERMKDAAIREVEEECGITNLAIVRSLPTTYHTYQFGSDRILKRTQWYEMKTNDRSPLVPQLEEGIVEARWMSPDEIHLAMRNTFPSVKDVVQSIQF